MIEIKAFNTGKRSGLAVAIDDAIYEEAHILISESAAELQTDSVGGDSFFEVVILDTEIADMVIAHRFCDLSKEIKRIVILPSAKLIEGETEISQGIAIRRDFIGVRGGYVGETYIAFNFYFDPDNWKRLWSIRDYQKEFRHTFERQNPPDIRWTPEEARIDGIGSIEDRISLTFSVQDDDTTIEAEAQRHSGMLTQLHEVTVSSLMSKLRQNSVVTYFNFPEEVRVPCEQYLLYFIQFLKDLGVEATAELQHEAGQALFAVTPKNKEEALDTIRAALTAFLSLPANPLNESSSGEIKIAIQRLTSNIYHLKSQLALAKAQVQAIEADVRAKQTTIEAQQRSIYLQERFIRGEVLLESITDITPSAEEGESGLEKVVSHTPEGREVDLSRLFEQLRLMFINRG